MKIRITTQDEDSAIVDGDEILHVKTKNVLFVKTEQNPTLIISFIS
jgi:hypothetical protein